MNAQQKNELQKSSMKIRRFLDDAISQILKKYKSDKFTIDCTKMDQFDYDLYVKIDEALERVKELEHNYFL